MGKLTKAQRDTLIKNIQEKKIEGIVTSILSALSFCLCLLIWLVGAYSKGPKFFWCALIAGIITFGIMLNSDEERKKMQAQLDEDSE